MRNGNKYYENMEILNYFLFEKRETTEETGYMKSVLAVGFVALTDIYDMPTGSVVCLVTKHCSGTHLVVCAATLTRQSLSLKFSLPRRINKLSI